MNMHIASTVVLDAPKPPMVSEVSALLSLRNEIVDMAKRYSGQSISDETMDAMTDLQSRVEEELINRPCVNILDVGAKFRLLADMIDGDGDPEGGLYYSETDILEAAVADLARRRIIDGQERGAYVDPMHRKMLGALGKAAPCPDDTMTFRLPEVYSFFEDDDGMIHIMAPGGVDIATVTKSIFNASWFQPGKAHSA